MNIQTIDGLKVVVSRRNFIYFNGVRIPGEVASLAAGPDAWMRKIILVCACGQKMMAGEMECGVCPTCYDEQGAENARLDAYLTEKDFDDVARMI